MIDFNLGSTFLGGGRCRFAVWAPFADKVEVHLLGRPERLLPLEKGAQGYYHAVIDDVEPASLYKYQLDGRKEWPDPASRSQPQGVHGPSQVVDPNFPWHDQPWRGVALADYIIYELHVGTFTPEGFFGAVIPHLDDLKELGITAVELMPVAQFPGDRNWGYDGVDLFAVQNSYGGPEGLKQLVDACHQRELAVVLDVVYNHFGPEGNYLQHYGPYFTDRYKTPWGSALNFDGPYSDEVRAFFIQNALYWYNEFHVDALRLDAVHAILDCSPRPFLQELAERIQQERSRISRKLYLIPESASNDARLIRSRELGGYGLDAQWNDDFHHSLRVLLTGEQNGYYQDYRGLDHLAKAFREGFVYSGEYSAYRRHRHGSSSRDIPAERFVVFCQNHDQVGNRMLGERLSELVPFEGLKLAASVVLLSPFIPLIFMGEEYGETAPFQYFISHSDSDLVEAVRKGRKDEFSAFQWEGDPPDPYDTETFKKCKLNHRLRDGGDHEILRRFYKELLRLRKEIPALSRLSKESMEVIENGREKALSVRRWNGASVVLMTLNFSEKPAMMTLPSSAQGWANRLDSAAPPWREPERPAAAETDARGGTTFWVQPKSVVLFESRG